MPKQLVIVIPARYSSTRLPGKPLVNIAGNTMLQRVCGVALAAAHQLEHVTVLVATEDQRIFEHAEAIEGITPVMTPEDCLTGSDRVLAALEAFNLTPDAVINLQGDTPFTPPHFLVEVAKVLLQENSADIVTPVTELSWLELDEFRENKKQTPFSGTTAIVADNSKALWFSKSIIPAIRNEKALRQHSEQSPVFRHIGIYGFQYEALKAYVKLPVSRYERLEGLEQLRMLENNLYVHAVRVDYQGLPAMTGIDTLEDVVRAEKLLSRM
jgi:3-deoxy-manno-octulosonate cytidylyltransferase (CMP-KDO synthetase)